MALSPNDFYVFEKYKKAGAHAFSTGEVIPEDKEVYWKIYQELTSLTKAAQKEIGLEESFNFYHCRLSKDGGIQGQRPKDLWTALYPKECADFAKHPEIYIIANHNGVEIGLAISINEADYYNEEVKGRNRKIIPQINDKLPLPGSQELRELEEKLGQTDAWFYYNHKERKWPHEKPYRTFPSASDLFSFLKSDPTAATGGGAICRYVPVNKIGSEGADISKLFFEAVNTFYPICLQCTPTSADKVQIQDFDILEEVTALVPEFDPKNEGDGRKKILSEMAVRQGQSKFRNKLIVAYEGRCAVTGMRVLEVLQAAHIMPYNGEDTNHIQNGILLRADIHTLFDLNLLSIDPETMSVVISKELSSSPYKRLKGRKIRLPRNKNNWPSSIVLKKHLENTNY